ncbi:MAG TPA: tol-pal system protein YbgF [Stellaceae bacterium]|nr:tol-pal system protein YbgF [Stellaceae bacterium]
MFRQSLLPCAYLAAALGLAILSAPAPAAAQDLSTQERLDRLERDLNMLQRQVYRGVPPSAASGDGSTAVNTEIRMERLETQMRDLTGRVEEVANRLEQVRQRVEQINSDVAARFTQAGMGSGLPPPANPPPANPPPPGPEAAAPPYPPPPGAGDTELTPPPDAALAMPPEPPMPPPGGAMAAPATGPTPIFGTLRPPGSPPSPAELGSTAAAAHPAPAGLLPSGSVSAQYNHAFGLLKKADYPAAEAALKAFIAAHPRDPLAGNAQYWLGETYYTRGKYMEAASAFAEGYRRYPKSAKAPDGLLKLGVSLGRAHQKKDACLAFAQLDHDFPHPGSAVREHEAVEKKRLGC